MMSLLLLCLSSLVCLEAITPTSLLVEQWETWKVEHGKTYGRITGASEGRLGGGSGGEEDFRLKIWMENKAGIERHNRRALQGKASYTMAMNQFGDLLHHEFTAAVNGYIPRADLNSSVVRGATFLPPAHSDSLPSSVDWRKLGAVTAVKNQGQCGSCWSFSATGALEAMTFRKTGILTSLSEQNLIDCSSKYGNGGCHGGLMDAAFQYIKDNQGIDTEQSYPYEAEDNVCRYNPRHKGAADVGFVDVAAGSEAALAVALATQGPCSVAIDASRRSFQFYSRGVYRDEECSPVKLDHGVLAVGYGLEAETGEEYWLVKNSWTSGWGDEGYIKIARNEGNMCGIATAASFPLV